MSDLTPTGEAGADGKKKKARPAVQLYRPGMLKSGTDITADKNWAESHKNKNDHRGEGGSTPQRGARENRGRGRGRRGRENRERKDYSFECESVCSNDGAWSIAGDGTMPERRAYRRKSSQSSSQSGTYKMGSNSNASSRKSSVCNLEEDSFRRDGPFRNKNQRDFSSVKQFHSSSQSLHDRPSSFRTFPLTEDRNWKLLEKKKRSEHASQPQSTRDGRDNTRDRGNASYSRSNFHRNDRYSSYREQPRNYSGGDGMVRKNDAFASCNNVNNMVFENSDIYGFRKLRPDDRRRGRGDGNRQRNWSFRSNQSERFEGRRPSRKEYESGRSTDEDYYEEHEICGTVEKKPSQTKPKSPAQHMSFQDLCASFDSIDFGSFDWSSEVEAEEQRKKEMEERERLEAMERARKEEKPSCSDTDLNWRIPNASRSTRRGGYSNRGRRRRNDSYTSQTSSIAESIEEADESESGERTPTYEEQVQKGKRKSIEDEESAGRRGGRGRGRGLHQTTRGKSSSQRSTRQEEMFSDDFHAPRVLQRNRPERRGQRGAPTNSGKSKPSARSDRNAAQLHKIPVNGMAGGRMVVDVSVPPPNLSVPPPPIRLLTASNQSAASSSPSGSVMPSTGTVRAAEQRKLNTSPTEWPIHAEIARKEGPQIQELNNIMSELFEKITESADVAAGEQLLSVSKSLSQLYLSILTREIDYTYSMNLEQHMWKQCFYKPIEVLRTASNAAGEAARGFHSSLASLIQQGLTFYKQLLNKYEVNFGFLIEDYIYWPSGLPTDDFLSCTSVGCGARDSTDRIIKVALLSTQRLTVSVGDLHRYNAMVTGVKDYTTARLWYQKSAQLGPGNGRSYNQQALLAVYMSKFIDVIFYYIRALAARYPFETARQPLFTAFNDMRKKIVDYEADLDERLTGHSERDESEMAYMLEERPRETWITPDGRRSEWNLEPVENKSASHIFETESVVTLYRRTVPYVLQTAGLLITKIDMETFDQISERALIQLSALLAREQCPMSSMQLVQLSSLFLFAVHNLTLANVDPDTCSLQQQQAVQTVLSILGVLLNPVEKCRKDIDAMLSGELPVPMKVQRVLPALFVLCEWLSTPSINRIYSNMPSLEPLETNIIRITTWHTLANVANALADAETKGKLARTVPTGSKCESVEVLLPESIFLVSFTEAFPSSPKTLHLSPLPLTDHLKSENASRQLALHARLSSVLSLAEFLDGSGLHCFCFDEHLRRFTTSVASLSPAPEHPASLAISKEPSSSTDRDFDENHELEDAAVSELSPEHLHYRQVLKENLLKKELLEKEGGENRVVIEVRPEYLVPDTNTFIDHLESIIRIVTSREFTILVPTTVISELTGLSQPLARKPGVAPSSDDSQENWVEQRAKLAINYLHEAAEKKIPHLYTVTSKGSRLPSLSFAVEENSYREQKTVNDDLILASCMALSASLPLPKVLNEASEPNKLYRSVVLLTEDRALNIKAVCANIPCRTIPSFAQWAGI